MARDAARASRRIRKLGFLHYDRNVYILLFYTFGKGLQLSIAALSINLYAYSLGFRSDFIGILTGMPAIGSFLTAVPAGLLADRFGRKPLILVSAVCTPITLFAIALSANGPLLLTASFINGLLASAYWITNPPLLTESTTDEQRVGVLALNTFMLLGVGTLGYLIGGAVPEFVGHLIHQPANTTIPLRWGVLAAGLAVTVTALPLIFLREPRRVAPNPGTEVVQGAAAMAGNRAMILLFVMLLIPDIIYITGESAVVGLLQLYFRLRFTLSVGLLGTLFTLIGLIGGATALIAPRLVKRWGKLRMVITLQSLSAPVMLAIGFAPNALLASSAEFGRTILRGLFEPIYATFAMESVPARRRATLSGFYGVTWGIGFSMGASIAGFLQYYVGLSAPFLAGAICLSLSPLLLYLFFGRKPSGKGHI